MTCIMLKCVPSVHTLWRVFIVSGYWILSETFPSSIEIIVWLLLFNSLVWSITLINLQILKKYLHPWDESPLIMMYDPFNLLLDSFPGILLRILCLCSSIILAVLSFLMVSLSSFGIRMIAASWNVFGSIPSSEIFWNNFGGLGVILFYILDGIHLWRQLMLDFCFLGIFKSLVPYQYSYYSWSVDIFFNSSC